MNPANSQPLPDEDEAQPATAFRITINGQPYCETDDLTTMTMVVGEVRGRAEHRITLYASANEGPLRWMTADLTVGDRIAIEIVDVVAERESEEVLACDFCGRDAHAVHALVQGPNGYICDLCIDAFSTAVGKGAALPLGASFGDDSTLPCRFCGKAAPDIGGVVTRNGAAICAECLRSVADIMSKRPSTDGLDQNEP